MIKYTVLLLTLIISCDMKKKELIEPKAKKIEKILSIHGDDRIDEYYWLNQRGDKDVIDYLNKENDYRNEFMKDYKPLENEIFQEIKSRIKEDDSTVPYFYNGYHYYTRYEKDKQYPIYCRKKGSLENTEEILIDANVMSEGYDYFRVGTIEISPDNKTMAYSIDTLSRRIYTIYFMDLESRIISEKNIKNSSGSITWANDNKTIFYNMKDSETLRSERVMRFKLGDNGNGSEVYFEEDETFSVFSYKTKTEKYIVIGSSATLSQEYRIINAEKPDEKPKLFQKKS